MPFTVTFPADASERQEGEPFYTLARYTYHGEDGAPSEGFAFDVRSFRVLPPSDAVGLLSGIDETGLIVWAGALGLTEWLLREPARLQRALAFPGRVLVLELGSGAGALAVVLHKLLHAHLVPSSVSTPPAACTAVELIATDGNAACVELTQRNLQEVQCRPTTAPLTSRTALLEWGHALDATGIVAGAVAQADCVRVASADVIYDAAAVPLLVSTVATLWRHFTLSRQPPSADVSHEDAAMEWWLLYTPRSLTRDSNIAIYGALQSALAEHATWRVVQLPLPPGCFTSGFDAAAAADAFALQGCIFVVQLA